jgi:hypothetical protein
MKSTLAPLLAVLLPLGLHAQSAPPSCLDGITLQTHDFNTGQPHSFISDGSTATIADGWTEPHRTSHLNYETVQKPL